MNAIILHRTLQARKQLRREGRQASVDSTWPGGWISKLAWPLFKAMDRPWKLLPLGILFGLGMPRVQ